MLQFSSYILPSSRDHKLQRRIVKRIKEKNSYFKPGDIFKGDRVCVDWLDTLLLSRATFILRVNSSSGRCHSLSYDRAWVRRRSRIGRLKTASAGEEPPPQRGVFLKSNRACSILSAFHQPSTFDPMTRVFIALISALLGRLIAGSVETMSPISRRD